MEKRVRRFGFPATLVDSISNYEIASGKNVDALIIEQSKEPEPVDFRMYFRVKPYLQSNISLVWKGNRVHLIDISLGGAKFSCPRDYLFPSSGPLNFKLTIGRSVFNLTARICSKGTVYDTEATGKELQYVSIEFDHDDKQLEASLGKAIIEIERQLLSQGRI
jgi:c-di-GMP-binding flagellar brake protein YcgR